jgi:hypothetical protein
MKGHKKYDLNDSKDLKQLNQLLKQAGITFQHNLLGVYVLVDLDHYNLFTKRKAGRRTVVTPAMETAVPLRRLEDSLHRRQDTSVHRNSSQSSQGTPGRR